MPHSIFEELWHLDYWQRRLLQRARGALAEEQGKGEDDWPGQQMPESPEDWARLLESIRIGLDEAAGMAADAEVMDRELSGGETVRGLVEAVVAHNSYHFGRVVALRQLQGNWPPHGIG